MGLRRRTPKIKDLVKAMQKNPKWKKEITLPSGRKATVKSNAKILESDIKTLSNIFDKQMYQTEEKIDLVEAALSKELYSVVRIFKTEDSYEIVVI